MSDHDDALIKLGTFLNRDAKRLLDELRSHDLHYETEVDSRPMQNMSPFTARYGGMYGLGTGVTIFVRPEDEAVARALSHKIMGLQV